MALVFAPIAISFLADRLLKNAIRRRELGWSKGPVRFLALTHSRHSIEHSAGESLCLAGLIVSTAIISFLLSNQWTIVQVCFSAALGGAAGNYLDAWSRSGVVNCFAVCGRWAFNLADVAISVGTFLGLTLTIMTSVGVR